MGVHKRVATPATVQMQRRMWVPSIETFVQRALGLFVARGGGARNLRVYLASDDAAAPPAFKDVFGDALYVFDDVRRTAGGIKGGKMNEVHNQPGCGLDEARDALADALCLSACDVLVHVDSNVGGSAREERRPPTVAAIRTRRPLDRAAAHERKIASCAFPRRSRSRSRS